MRPNSGLSNSNTEHSVSTRSLVMYELPVLGRAGTTVPRTVLIRTVNLVRSLAGSENVYAPSALAVFGVRGPRPETGIGQARTATRQVANRATIGTTAKVRKEG